MIDDLDTRARAGAVALRDAVRGLPVEPAGRRTHPPRRGRVALVAAAVAALVVLTVSVLGDGTDEQRLSTNPSGGAPRLVLGTTPSGMALTGAADLPLPGQSSLQGTYWVYGDAAADDPFADRDLAVIHFASGAEQMTPPDGSEPTEVDGHPAWVAPPPVDQGELGGPSVYIELDGSTLGLVSRTLSDAELLAGAGEIDLDAVPLDLPEQVQGLDEVGTAHGAFNPGAAALPFPVEKGHLVGYSDDTADGGRSIAVAAVEGGDGMIAVARWALGATAHPVQVRGVDGWSGAPFGEGSEMAIWQESATVVVAMVGFGVEEGALLEAAASLRVATDAEWTGLLSLFDTRTVPRDAQVGISGTDEITGAAYAAYLDAEGQLCLAYDEAAGSSLESCGGSGPDAPIITVSTQRLETGGIVLYGYTTLGTDGDLRIEAADGSLASFSEAFHEAGTLFAGAFTDDTLPAEVIVRGADGAELARAEVEAPDQRSGSSGFSAEGTPITGG
jgi:hypothetical protein